MAPSLGPPGFLGIAMIGGFPGTFSQRSRIVACFGVRGVQQSEMAMIGGFRWNFPQAGVGVTLTLARSRSMKSMVAMIGGFPNQTFTQVRWNHRKGCHQAVTPDSSTPPAGIGRGFLDRLGIAARDNRALYKRLCAQDSLALHFVPRIITPASAGSRSVSRAKRGLHQGYAVAPGRNQSQATGASESGADNGFESDAFEVCRAPERSAACRRPSRFVQCPTSTRQARRAAGPRVAVEAFP